MSIKNKLQTVILIVVIIASCKKEKITLIKPAPITLSSLSGKEFVYDSLRWAYYNSGSGSPSWDEIYLSIPPRPEWFTSDFRNAKTFLRLDTTTVWIEVKSEELFDPRLSVQYVYNIYSSGLVINVWPLNHQLISKKAAIKIKFL